MKNRSQPQPPSLPPEPESSAVADTPIPASLEGLAAEADGAGDVIAPGATAAPDKMSGAPAQPEVPTADFLAGMLEPAFEQLAPNWQVKRQEVKMLAVGWGAVLDHYFPGGVGAWGPWGLALGSTVAVIGPRLNVPPRLEEKPAEPAPPAGG